MITQTKVNKLLRKCYELESNMRFINVMIEGTEVKMGHLKAKAERLKKRQLGVMAKLDSLADDIKAIDPLN